LFKIKPQELKDFLDLNSLKEQNIHGLNVTIPYKEKVLDFVKLDPESFVVRQIKAVNTIILKDGVLKGFNTDILGFCKALAEKNGKLENKRVAILGAGGASRAVVFALATDKVKEIAIYDIDKNKSQNILNLIKGLFPGLSILAVDKIEELNIKEKDLLINATPIGMKPDDPCLVTEKMLHKNLFVYDLIYNPAETKLLALANKIGAKNANGLDMLLYQGERSLELFIDQKISSEVTEVMRKALRDAISKQKPKN
jgi:shikimate dehydrogenase